MTSKTARWLAGIAGGVWGLCVGVLAAALVVTLTCGGNPMVAGFVFMFAAPVGMVGGTIWGVHRALALLPSALPFRLTNPFLVRAAIFGVGIPAVLVAGFYLPFNPFIPPSDRALLAEFAKKEAALNQLVSRIQRDKDVQIVTLEWSQATNHQDDAISSARLDEYRRLLRLAAVGSIHKVTVDGGSVRFPRWIDGGGPASENIKGFVYLSHPPRKNYASLDGARQEATEYRHIKGHWYLFYQWIQ